MPNILETKIQTYEVNKMREKLLELGEYDFLKQLAAELSEEAKKSGK